MQKTENYQLNQWNKTDRIQMEDFNADNAKIEAALTELAEQAAQIDKCGNCMVYHTSYTGTGSSGSSGACSLTFPSKPLLVVVTGASSFGVFVAGTNTMYVVTNATSFCNASLSNGEKTLNWSTSNAVSQMNLSGTTYYATALMSAE